MTSRREILEFGLMAAIAGLAGNPTGAHAEEKTAEFLFVQTAKSVKYDAGAAELTLVGVAPMTLFFTDRPERLAGNMKTAHFIPFWSEGKDSFKSDPPNADISVLEGTQLRQTVVELQDPRLEGDDLVYKVKIIGGEMPKTGADVSVFIDIIGRPLTPLSYAGVARRSYRRAYYYYR